MISPAANVSAIRDAVAALPREDWKYTDLERVIETGDRWARTPDVRQDVPQALIENARQTFQADWLVVCNGQVIDALSNAMTTHGVVVSTGGKDEPDAAQSPLAKLNAQMRSDALRVTIDAEFTNERPLAILVVDSARNGAGLAHTRVDIRVADRCRADIIEWHLSDGEHDLWSNAVFSAALGDHAQLNYQRIQQRRHNHDQTNQLSVRLGRESVLRHSGVDLGGRLTRNDLSVDISAPDADAGFDGLYVAGDGQHVDNHTRVDHRVGPARSSQEYRGILSGQCRAVWNGKAVVHAGADGTDAEQANHNLLLTERAEIDAKPELEIYADEVKCSHGTTVGQLDERALFYLRSRGLTRDHAERVLTRAFATRIVDRSPIESVRDWLHDIVETRLRELAEGNRS